MGASPPAAIGSRAGRAAAFFGSCAASAIVALAGATPAPAALDVPARVADINPNGSSSTLTPTALGRWVYFRASDGTTGEELWRSDGTEAGTEQVADIYPGPSGSLPAVITRFRDVVMFSAYEPTGGDELWRSDGTEAGTTRVFNIRPGAASSQPRHLLAYDDGVLFSADDGATGTEPWVSDGTGLGTDPLADINPGGAPGAGGFFDPVLRGERAFFAASDPVAGNELWRADLGTREVDLVANIALAGSSGPRSLTPAGGWIYFTADDNIAGRELWRSDGEPGGTYELVENLDGAATDSGVSSLAAFKGRVYFQGPDGGNGVELLRTSVPGPGTEIVADVNPAGDSVPQSITATDDGLFFTAVTPGSGRELWHTDGVPGGTTEQVDEIDPGGSSICPIPYLTELNGEVFFCADDGTHGNELWRSDGTAAGTEMVGDINPAGSSNPGSLGLQGDTLFFTADDGTGTELYAVDTAAPQTLLIDSPAAGGHIADDTPPLRLSSSAIDLDRFQCSTGSGWSRCAGRNGQGSAGPLADGPVDLEARAVDVRGNPDPSPVPVPAFTVDTTAPAVRAKGRKLRVQRKRARIKGRCAKSELTGPCRVKLGLKTRKKVRLGGKRKRLKLAKGKAVIEPGGRKRVKLRFRNQAVKALTASPRARRATLTIKSADALGNRSSRHKRVKLTRPRR